MNNQFGIVLFCLFMSLLFLLAIGVMFLNLAESIKRKEKFDIVLFSIILILEWLFIAHTIYLTTLTPTATWL